MNDQEAFLNEGFDEYKAKPFKREELTEIIENALSDGGGRSEV